MKFVLGVDEAGRGPLAGPVAVGAVLVPVRFDVAREFPGLKDSKQLSELARERIFGLLRAREKKGDLQYCVRFRSNDIIDRVGITRAVAVATARAVRSLAPSARGVSVLLDGLLHAPIEYAQETIIGGDESVPLIALASIAAKVKRDQLMRRFEREFPEYGFAKHKGYGTPGHYKMLRKYGPSTIHRLTYLHFTQGS